MNGHPCGAPEVAPVPAPPANRRVTRSWRPAPESVPDARHHTRAVLGNWKLPAIIDDAEAIVSELFTNAVQASTGPSSTISLRLYADHDQLLIMVWDGSPQMPAARHASPDDIDGRGLMIVEALSDACGSAPSGDGGKTVWAKMLVER
jgi:anti-sigma regulatory factor (Ser/Thr protein kinase)